MKRKLGVVENRPLADFLPTITITAKQLAIEITNFRRFPEFAKKINNSLHNIK